MTAQSCPPSARREPSRRGVDSVFSGCGLVVLCGLLILLPSNSARSQPIEGNRIPDRRLKTGTEFRYAFREVVSDARRSTVEVFANGRRAALGTVVDHDGWILTKASELNGRIVCRFHDARELSAELVGIHRDHDLAMLKVDADNLEPIAWSDKSDPAVGTWLVTPGTAEIPVAVGIVGVGRRPIPHQRGLLGIALSDNENDAQISQVVSNSGAERAGLKEGDRVTHVDGKRVANSAALVSLLRSYHPGESVLLRVLRDGIELDFEATLGSPAVHFMDRETFQNQLGGELSQRRGGFPQTIQHDSVLRPEECGGPVLNLSGQAVGVNIARAGRTESYAIPTSEIRPLLDRLQSGDLAPPTKPTLPRSTPPAPALPTAAG